MQKKKKTKGLSSSQETMKCFVKWVAERTRGEEEQAVACSILCFVENSPQNQEHND